jgi:hypothetical protein
LRSRGTVGLSLGLGQRVHVQLRCGWAWRVIKRLLVEMPVEKRELVAIVVASAIAFSISGA